MIYGIVPAGGLGSRLGLPYAKEMLPQKDFDYYNPLINYIVSSMKASGAEQIYFIHGLEYKSLIVDYFSSCEHVHIKQQTAGFANCLKDFYLSAKPSDSDQILFGMGDTVFNDNPFKDMLAVPGIGCGMFRGRDSAKVDRLSNNNQFDVKTVKSETNSDQFWGVLKFDGANLSQFIQDNMFDQYSEIGHIINHYPFNLVRGGDYIDLGTWADYNQYLKL